MPSKKRKEAWGEGDTIFIQSSPSIYAGDLAYYAGDGAVNTSPAPTEIPTNSIIGIVESVESVESVEDNNIITINFNYTPPRPAEYMHFSFSVKPLNTKNKEMKKLYDEIYEFSNDLRNSVNRVAGNIVKYNRDGFYIDYDTGATASGITYLQSDTSDRFEMRQREEDKKREAKRIKEEETQEFYNKVLE